MEICPDYFTSPSPSEREIRFENCQKFETSVGTEVFVDWRKKGNYRDNFSVLYCSNVKLILNVINVNVLNVNSSVEMTLS